MHRKILCILICFSLLFSLTACKKESAQPSFDDTLESNSLSGKVIAQNDKFRLEWDFLTKGITLIEISTGKTWGSSPSASAEEELDEMGMPIKKHDKVNSAISVFYKGASSSDSEELYSYSGAVQSGQVHCEKSENGLSVEYCFSEVGIMIPVTYTLHDEYVSVSVDPVKIQEGENTVTAVSLAPFWCSAENDAADSYLFIPSGCGAISEPMTVSNQGNTFSAQVYGKDDTMEDWYTPTNEKDIRMPVYGCRTGDTATCAVIDCGAESASIEAIVGSSAYRYSAVYASFQLRGYTTHIASVFNDMNVASIYSEHMIQTPISVRFYPLTGDKANYSGMAEIYRNYLIDNCDLKDSSAQTILNLNFIGGTTVTKSLLGIPYTTVYPATTLRQVSDMVQELWDDIGSFSVNLRGFGKSGIDIGKIAGGYGIHKALGTSADLKRLSALCGEKDLPLYMDFDIARFAKSGNGFSTFSDATSTSGNQKAMKYLSDKAVRDEVDNTLHYLLSPSQLENAALKLLKKANSWKLNGVTLSTLSSMAYSDYSDRDSTDYYSRSGFAKTVTDSISDIKKSGKDFMAADANIYAALLADQIIDVPTQSSGEQLFSEDVPFYEMVLRGYVPLSVESVNLSADPSKAVLAAVESGSGLSYTLISQWNSLLISAEYPYFYSSIYANVKDDIITSAKKLSDYYGKVAGAHIVSHTILDTGLRKTVFDNGITVLVNKKDTAVMTPYGEVAALDYRVLEGGI